MGRKKKWETPRRDPACSLEEHFPIALELTSTGKGTSANGKGRQESPSHTTVQGFPIAKVLFANIALFKSHHNQAIQIVFCLFYRLGHSGSERWWNYLKLKASKRHSQVFWILIWCHFIILCRFSEKYPLQQGSLTPRPRMEDRSSC